MKSQALTNTYRQLRNPESWRDSLPQGREQQLFMAYE